MAQVTRSQAADNLASRFEDNNSKNITPERLRNQFQDIQDSALWYTDGAESINGNIIKFDRALGYIIGLLDTLTDTLAFNLTNARFGARCLVVYKGTSMPTLPAYVKTDGLVFKSGGTQYWSFVFLDNNTIVAKSAFQEGGSSIKFESSTNPQAFNDYDALMNSDGFSAEFIPDQPSLGGTALKLSPISKVYDWRNLSSQTIINTKNKPTYIVGRETSGGSNITLPANAGVQEGDGFKIIHTYSYRYDAIRLTLPSGGTYADLTEELNTDYFIMPMGSEIEFIFDGTRWIQTKLVRVNDRGRYKGSSAIAYTLIQEDEHVRIEFITTSGVETVITLPNGLPEGWSTEVVNRGPGSLAFIVENGGTLLSNGSKVASENEMAFLEVRNKIDGDNTWIGIGNLTN